ncbi:leucine-rich repeat protein soc-2 homolog [Anopheles aquasalis]|uniref:leucine-rich repeat protein soc-2 homolog n=1 Tax=Anopheles aquasalis TaxID=42839 RepID=UPI00215B0F19|nr:leucine-rich repeat protein soc-2 homolog [Anopheles aquasalis]
MSFFTSLLWIMILTLSPNARSDIPPFSYVIGNVSCTINNLVSEEVVGNYSFLTNNIEELIFSNASIAQLDLTVPLSIIDPWKVLIKSSNMKQLVFPSEMRASVVKLNNVDVGDIYFNENNHLQDFRADNISLTQVPTSVVYLHTLDILWFTHSPITTFSFDLLENSSLSLLYMVANKIESLTISPDIICCKKLEEIFLSGNQLKQLDLAIFSLMVSLSSIFLEDNQLNVINATNISIDQKENSSKPFGLSKALEDQFCSWNGLYSNQIQNESFIIYPRLLNCTDFYANLISIHLARNQIHKIDFNTFSLMNNLNSIDLSNNMLSALISSNNKVPLRLSELFVSNNNISEVFLKPLPSLKALYLHDNNIMQLNMSSLPHDLDYLNLINNPLDCEELPHMNRSVNLPTVGPFTEC